MSPREVHPKLTSAVASIAAMEVVSITGSERLSRPFRFLVEVNNNPGDDDIPWDQLPSKWLNQAVAIDLLPLDPTDVPNGIHGVVGAIEDLGFLPTSDKEFHHVYRLEIIPRLQLLSLARRTRLFENTKPFEAVKTVLGEWSIKFQSRVADGKRPYTANLAHITQYDETDLDFVSRLLEDEGICYWFDPSDGTMVLGNDPDHHPGEGDAIGKDLPLAVPNQSRIGRRVGLLPQEAQVADYDFNNPNDPRIGIKRIRSQVTIANSGMTYYGGVNMDGGVADNLASIAADRLVNASCTFHGESHDVRIRAGRRSVLEGHNCHCLVIGVEHNWRHLEAGGDSIYHNGFSWIQWEALPWRPPREAPRPDIRALVPGFITAIAGQQGQVQDETLDGSYRVRLPVHKKDDPSSDRAMRLAQPYLGQDRGFHFPLPVDTEVLLAHVNGDPDRPVIASSVPNVNHPGPVLAGNNTQCAIKTGSGHQLVLEDKKDEEKITLTSKSGHKLELDDKPDTGKVSLISLAGAAMVLDDKSGEEKTTLLSKAGAGLKMEDKGGEEKTSLTSKAGASLLMDDKPGEEKTALTSKAGQKLEILDKGGSEQITLIATKDLAITVGGETKLTTTKTTLIDGQDEITISSTKKITLKVGQASIVLDDQGNITISGTAIKLEATGDIKASGMNVEFDAKGNLKGSGANVEFAAQMGAKLAGNATAELSASGQTTVKGAIVMIN